MESTRNICTIEDCHAFITGHGFCSKHYQRFRKYGDPHFCRAYLNPIESLNRRLKLDGGCIIWTGHVTEDGYGRLSVNGRLIMTHRFAWESERGPIPEGLQIDHTCHREACCNVEHLRLATGKQNSENKRGANSQNKSSGVRGVHRHKGRWRVRVRHYGKTYYGGRFATVEEAERAAIALRNRLYTHNLADRA